MLRTRRPSAGISLVLREFNLAHPKMEEHTKYFTPGRGCLIWKSSSSDDIAVLVDEVGRKNHLT